jgi:hypothetical protein
VCGGEKGKSFSDCEDSGNFLGAWGVLKNIFGDVLEILDVSAESSSITLTCCCVSAERSEVELVVIGLLPKLIKLRD